MEITIFKDIKDTAQPFYRDVSKILERIQEGASQDIVRSIRVEKDKEIRDKLKQSLPAVCFSGKFSKRNDSSLLEHSGLRYQQRQILINNFLIHYNYTMIVNILIYHVRMFQEYVMNLMIL